MQNTDTITSRKKLKEEFLRIQKRGVALNDGETDLGIRSVAAPVRDRSGRVIAALNISVPSIRMTREDLQTRLAEEVRRVAGILSEALGYQAAQGGSP